MRGYEGITGLDAHWKHADDYDLLPDYPGPPPALAGEPEPLILRALRGERVERPPIWLMRQAGRFLPEYRALREHRTFLEVCGSPELATEATLQPIRRFGFDAAILFSDILLVLDAMGAGLRFDERGPVFDRPIRSIYEVRHLKPVDPDRDLPHVAAAIQQVNAALPPTIPLLGFAGAPFTLLTYLLEGRGERRIATARSLLLAEPVLSQNILMKLSEAVIAQLTAQVAAGVKAVQLFESCGNHLTLELWRRFAAPAVRRIAFAVSKLGVPVIYFTRGTASLASHLTEAGADVYSVDWQCDLATVREQLGQQVPVQGNLDPAVLLTTPDVVRRRAAQLIAEAGPQGYVFNLGHGVLPQTDPELVRVLVDTVRTANAGGSEQRLARSA